MKKLNFAKSLMALMMIFGFLAVGTIAVASELELNTPIESMVVANDKNGNEYVRFIILEARSLNGIEYTKDMVVMAFGSTVENAKKLSAGDTLHAIAEMNEYKNRTNYNILSFIQ